MDTSQLIADKVKTLVADPSLGSFEVTAKTEHSHSSPDEKAQTTLLLTLKNPLIEEDPGKVEKHVVDKLATLDALKPYVNFEAEKKHMERLATTLKELRDAEVAMNEKLTGQRIATIPENYSKWFEELPKRDKWDLKHALKVRNNNDLGITLDIDVPKDVDPEMIKKNFADRMDAIKATLADRIIKYSPELDTDAKKEELRANVKALDVKIEAYKDEYNRSVTIDLRSAKQLEINKMEGLTKHDKLDKLTDEEKKTLKDSNPISKLKDGDGLTPENPAHLKKALARSFLFAGDKANDIFPLIAGKEDMRIAVIKSLVRLKELSKANNPEIAKKAEEFLADDVFKSPDRWNTPLDEKQTFKSPISIVKKDSPHYTPGEMKVELTIPAEKYAEVRQQLAGVTPEQAAGIPADAATQALTAPLPTQSLESAANAIIAAGSSLTGWANKMENQKSEKGAGFTLAG